MMTFGRNISNRVKSAVGREDRRRGSIPRNMDGAYLKGFRNKEKGRRPYFRREVIDFDTAD
ncbi:MAG: hypothetical protein LBR70_04025 [Lactobacillaceae bacterium]|jgi:hypothetical protein|nr:hypothetical protein [Lactobacillaceae bacterium]